MELNAEILKLADEGKELWSRITSDLLIDKHVRPIMLPPAPNQQYVDQYEEKELAEVKAKSNFSRMRLDYDAECLVYQALENLNEKIIVLHDFSYSTEQSQNLMISEKPSEGQHDFVVLVPQRALIIIIEVKNPDKNKKKSVDRSWNSAGAQIKQFEMLLEGICTKIKKPSYLSLGFRAFPLVDREFIYGKADLSSLLCKQDFENFPVWWEHHVVSQFGESVDNELMSNVLMGLWMRNFKLKLSESKRGNKKLEISRNIVANTVCYIESMLSSQRIYFDEQKKSNNLVKLCANHPHLLKSQHFSDINYITKDQEALLSAGPHVFVNGPAGSGKTLIMTARILKLLSDMSKNKFYEQILVLVPWKGAAVELENILVEFDGSLSVKMMDLVHEIRKNQCDTVIFSDVLEKSTEHVIIFIKPNFRFNSGLTRDYKTEPLNMVHECFIRMLLRKSNHIFCDDFHNGIAHYVISCKENDSQYMDPSSVKNSVQTIAQSLLSIFNDHCSSQKTLWVGCDILQIVQYAFWGSKDLYKQVSSYFILLMQNIPTTDVFWLSGNLRNSYSIALLLNEMRGKFLETAGECDKDLKQIIPNQRFQHFIRGFNPCLYCVYGKDASERAADLVRSELTVICKALQGCANNSGAGNSKCIKENIALIPVYNHQCYMANAETVGLGNCFDDFQVFKERIKTIAAEFKVYGHNIFTDNVKYSNSIEFPFAILIFDMSYNPEQEESHREALLNLLAHLYLSVSRASVWCSIVFICSNDTPSKLLSQICEVLHPLVKTVRY